MGPIISNIQNENFNFEWLTFLQSKLQITTDSRGRESKRDIVKSIRSIAISASTGYSESGWKSTLEHLIFPEVHVPLQKFHCHKTLSHFVPYN